MTKAQEIQQAIEAGDMDYDYETQQQAEAALANNAEYQAKRATINSLLKELMDCGQVTVTEHGVAFHSPEALDALKQATGNAEVN